LNGPELIGYREQVNAIAAAIGGAVRFEQVTPERARALYLEQGGFAAQNADFLLGFADYGGAETGPEAVAAFDPAAFGSMPTAQEATGRPARTFTEWARDHARDFLPAGWPTTPSAGRSATCAAWRDRLGGR
jgi:hypothetical protein